VGRLDLDPLGRLLDLGRLRQRDRQHAFVEPRVDLVLIDLERQAERTREGA
jgi:hypothetical protein